MMTHLTQKLFAIFKDSSRTFFDEYPTLSALGEHLLERYPQACLQWTGQLFRYPSHAAYSGTLKKEEVCGPNPPRQNLRTDVLSLYPLPNGSQTAIAIIGISGRYPQAKSMEEYWENLKAGKSCITEIPRSRWDWRDYYQNNREQ